MDVGAVGDRTTQVPEMWPVLKVRQVSGMWPCCMHRSAIEKRR